MFRHRVVEKHVKLLRGFDDVFYVPHSRHTEIRRADVEKVPQLEILVESQEAGVYVLATRDGRQVFVTGHSEYDPLTLKKEYDRDVAAGLPIAVPVNYYPGDDPTQAADRELARARAPAVRQLDQLLRVPGNAVRPARTSSGLHHSSCRAAALAKRLTPDYTHAIMTTIRVVISCGNNRLL